MHRGFLVFFFLINKLQNFCNASRTEVLTLRETLKEGAGSLEALETDRVLGAQLKLNLSLREVLKQVQDGNLGDSIIPICHCEEPRTVNLRDKLRDAAISPFRSNIKLNFVKSNFCKS